MVARKPRKLCQPDVNPFTKENIKMDTVSIGYTISMKPVMDSDERCLSEIGWIKTCAEQRKTQLRPRLKWAQTYNFVVL